jgi:tetratricopeptide (TPR) repeat protein
MKSIFILFIVLPAFLLAEEHQGISVYNKQFDTMIDDAFSSPWDSARVIYKEAELLMDSLLLVYPDKPDILARTAISKVQLLRYEDYDSQIYRVQKIDSLTQRSLEIDSTHAITLVIRGILNYRLSNLSWIERFIVNTFIGTLPQTSYEKSVAYLRKAIQYYDSSPYYHFALGRTLLALERQPAARQALVQAVSIPPENQLDRHYQDVARRWLTNLKEGKTFDLHHK